MKTEVEHPDSLHAHIKVELPWPMVADELDRAYRELGKDVSIKGFRKGKVPRNVLRQRFGKRVEQEVLDRMIQESFEAAVIQNRIRPASRPELHRGKLVEGQPYSYAATVEIQPEIELKNTAITVEQPAPEVTDEMIDAELGRLQEEKAVLVPVEGRTTAQQGDTVILDYTASQGGKPLEGGEVTNHEILLGAGKSVPGFEDQVVGMQVGQTRAFDLVFPQDWGSGKLAGQTVHFRATLNAIKLRELPQLDDEFARDLGREGCNSLQDLRKQLEQELLVKERARIERETKDKLVDGLIEANPFPVPPSLVGRQQQALAQEVEMFFAHQGMSPEQAGLNRRKMKDDMRERAEREVRSAMLLDAVARREKIEVSEQDIEEQFDKIAARTGQNLLKIKGLYSDEERRNELRYKIRQEKVLDYLQGVSNMKPGAGGAEAPGETASSSEESQAQPEETSGENT